MRGVVADRTFPESGTCARSHILSGSKVVRPAAKSARASSAKAFSTSWDWANLRVHPSSDTSSDCSHPAIRPRDVRMRPTTDRRRRGQMIVRFHVRIAIAVAAARRAGGLAALALAARAKRSLRRLTRYPQSGRKIPEFPELAHREVIVPPYRFFYRVGKPTVWIVAVWHGAQLPVSPQPGRRRTSR